MNKIDIEKRELDHKKISSYTEEQDRLRSLKIRMGALLLIDAILNIVGARSGKVNLLC